MRLLTQGYQPAFSKTTGAYREENNRSALTDMEVVKDQVHKWKEGGYITELPTPALCTNPLSVVFLFFSPPPFQSFFTFTKEVGVFWQQCQQDQILQGFLLLQRGSIMLSFSETNLVKRFTPIAMISLLVLHTKVRQQRPRGVTVLNCKHLPNVCKFLLGLEAQILDTAFSYGAERCGSKTFSILSEFAVCTSFHSLPSSPFRHSSSVTYSMFIDVTIYLFIESLTYSYEPCTVRYKLFYSSSSR